MSDGWASLSPALSARASPDDLDFIYGKLFKSAEGQKVLAHMRSITIEQPVFVPGEDPSFGYSRAGMCELVRMIERRVERSNNV